MLAPLWLTLKIALLATLMAGTLGIALGWWMSQRRFAGRNVVDAVLMLPMVLPPTVLVSTYTSRGMEIAVAELPSSGMRMSRIVSVFSPSSSPVPAGSATTSTCRQRPPT